MRSVIAKALGKNDGDAITNSDITKLTYLDCSNSSITNITGLVSTFTNLQRLNLSKNTELNDPDLLTGAIYKLVSLDVSECAKLTTLNLMTSVADENADNKLVLQYLNCSATPLATLNLAKCPELVSLDCSNAKLSALDLTNNTKLRSLKLDNMGYGGVNLPNGATPTLATLNVTTCTDLRELSLSWGMASAKTNNRNPISELDVSKCTKLETLNCRGSNIKTLDLSNNVALKTLNCTYNSLLTTLKFGNNPELYYVYCETAGLTEIDISTCPKLTVDKNNGGLGGLYCDDNVTVISSPKFHSNELILRGNLGMVFNIEWPTKDMTNYFQTNTSMSFDVNGESTSIFAGSNAVHSEGEDIFGYECPVNSVQIADTIKAYFAYTNKDEETTIISKDYTVQKYLDTAEKDSGPWYSTAIKDWINPKDAELYELVKAIKDFGHYVQPVLAKNNSWEIGTKHALIEAGNVYSDDYVAKAAEAVKSYTMTSEDKSSGLNLSYTLQLDSMTKLIVYLEPSEGVTDVSAKLDGGTAEMALQSIGDYYYVEIDDISPHMLSQDHTISVTTSKGSLTLNISALSYADAILNPKSGTTPNLGHNITDDEARKAAASIYYYCEKTQKYRAKKGYTN